MMEILGFILILLFGAALIGILVSLFIFLVIYKASEYEEVE